MDETGKFDEMEMRDLADWVIRYQLQSQGGIANVLNIGGYVKQYQVFVNPEQLINYNLSLEDVADALAKSNENSAGGFLIKDTRELMIRGLGRISTVSDIENVVIDVRGHSTPILIKDVGKRENRRTARNPARGGEPQWTRDRLGEGSEAAGNQYIKPQRQSGFRPEIARKVAARRCKG